ncbi:hypothetical protein DFH09DRAFT_1309580 [Mycena vulgaris]|nr:hypothetical protein DFH09DRAFT_1309580 [Mycena vulgaris]
MRRGEFTESQRLYIETYLEAFTTLLDTGVGARKQTEWKQATALSILDSPQFSDLDTTKNPRTKWFKMIVRKFTNYRTQVYLKHNPVSAAMSGPPGSGPLFRFSSVLTGRQLFAKENSAIINTAAKQRVATLGHGSVAGFYQSVLKERWDALDDEDKLEWQERAEEGAGDMASNQAEFGRKMHAALTDLSQGGLLGDAELLLFYGFRNPTSGDLDIGTHSEMQANYGNPWAAFAESVIPRPIVEETSVIPRNAFGVPVFPSIDLNIVTPADTRVLLTEYWAHLWDSNYPPIPWAAIANNPSGYYDTMRFNLPLSLIAPQTLNTLHTTVWAEYFVRTSSLFEDSPFTFYPRCQHPTTEETVSRPEVGMAGGIESISNDSNGGEPGSASGTVHIPVSDESNSGGPGGASETVHTEDPIDSTAPILPNTTNNGPIETSETPTPQDDVHNLKRSKQVFYSVLAVTVLMFFISPEEHSEIAKPRKKRANQGDQNHPSEPENPVVDGHRQSRKGSKSAIASAGKTLRRSTRQPAAKVSTANSEKKGGRPARRRRTLGFVYSDEESDVFNED